MRRAEQSDLLTMVLGFVFQGKPPVGEAVRNSDMAAAGIEVFDYARQAGGNWLRIWVLKETRKPIRMKVFEPDEDGFMQVDFDYMDPQPAAFFDADKFAATARAAGPGVDARQVYVIGSPAPVGGKARDSQQIYEAAGGYHAPKVRRAVANPEGDIALITSIPMNRTPQGGAPMEEGYEGAMDTWGNRYLVVRGSMGVSPDGDARWYLLPVGTFKTGTGPRRLTTHYVIQTFAGGTVGFQYKDLGPETVEVEAGAGQPDDWDKEYQRERPAALRTYYRSTGTLAEQLNRVEQALAKDPGSVPDLLWKFDLLREHGRATEAWKLFEQSLQARLLAGPEGLLGDGYTAPAEYLVYLAHGERWDDFQAVAAAVERIRELGLKSKDARVKAWTQYVFRTDYPGLLAQAVRLKTWLDLIEKEPARVTDVVASKDGMVCVKLRVPPEPDVWQGIGEGGALASK